MLKASFALFVVLVVLPIAPAATADTGTGGVEVHGYGGWTYARSDGNLYLGSSE